MYDFLDEFSDLDEFDPTATVNPDSVVFTGQSKTVFNKTYTSKVKFNLLDGSNFKAKAIGYTSNLDRFGIIINGDYQTFEVGFDSFIFSLDAFLRMQNGTAKYKMTFSNEKIFTETLTLSSPSVPVNLGTQYDEKSIYNIMAGKQTFVNSLSKIGFTSQKTVYPTISNVYIGWKIRCRLAKEKYYTELEEKSAMYNSFTTAEYQLIGNLFPEKTSGTEAQSKMQNFINAIINK